MSCGTRLNLKLCVGETFKYSIRLGSGTNVTKTITAITQDFPAVITAASHAVPDGWPVYITGVQGMDEINSEHIPPEADDLHTATVVNANSVKLNGPLNPVDSTEFLAYTSGGKLCYEEPRDISTDNCTFTIYDADGTSILALTSSPAAGITMDSANYQINVVATDEQTTLLDDYVGMVGSSYEWNLLTAAGEVFPLYFGKMTITE